MIVSDLDGLLEELAKYSKDSGDLNVKGILGLMGDWYADSDQPLKEEACRWLVTKKKFPGFFRKELNRTSRSNRENNWTWFSGRSYSGSDMDVIRPVIFDNLKDFDYKETGYKEYYSFYESIVAFVEAFANLSPEERRSV